MKTIYDKLHQDLLKEDILHADETELQVLREEGKSPQSKSYMRLYRSGVTARAPIVLYHYERDRRHDRPKDFLDSFTGYLHSDGYDAYHKLDAVVSVGCLAHVRRKFVEAAEVASKNKGSSHLAGKAVEDLRQIFAWETFCENMTLEERYRKRLEKQKPLLEAFFEWVESISVSEKSALGKARIYALGQKKYVLNVYQDKRLELTNNHAERSIKLFCDGTQDLPLCQHAQGCRGQRGPLFPRGNCQRNRSGSVPVLCFRTR